MSKGKSDKKKRRKEKMQRWLARRQVARAGGPQARPAHEFSPEQAALASAEGPKLSARIWDLIKPYRDPDREDIEPQDEVTRLLDAAVLAWNIALLPTDEHERRLDEAVQGLSRGDPQAREAAREFLANLVRRKLKRFPTDDRGVANYRLTDRGGQWNLTVLSMRRAPDSGE